MLATIKFDNELSFEANKVNDIIPNWLLSPEFHAIKVFILQEIPQFLFSVSLPLPEISCGTYRICAFIQYLYPLTLNPLRSAELTTKPTRGEEILL